MAEVPENIIKECQERFGEMVYFQFVPWKEKFVAKAKDPIDMTVTYDLFVVEDDLRRYRPIMMEDILRIEKSRVIDPEAKEKAKKELEAKLMTERRAKLQKTPESKRRKEAFTEIANDCATNPIAARGFVNDAKRKYKVKSKTVGNRTTLSTEK